MVPSRPTPLSDEAPSNAGVAETNASKVSFTAMSSTNSKDIETGVPKKQKKVVLVDVDLPKPPSVFETEEEAAAVAAPDPPASSLRSTSSASKRKISAYASRHKSSVLDTNDDPFAEREGKTLTWRNVNMTLQNSAGEPDRKILDNVWGEVPNKQTTAIMGPSGAGKSSLLNVLAGRASSRGRVTIESDIRLNNYVVDPTKISVRKHIAFVAQDDSLQPTATPRESIYFSAKLRLSKYTEEKTLQKLVNRLLEELGLSHCADTYVGGLLLKGISGGERKRTSVGVELVTKPAMVFLDEPTSGLDSFSAVQLCEVLKKVANAGASVMFTIHQPASEIFNSFDRLILLSKGKVMYQGSVQAIPDYFAKRGQPVPPNYNPADHIMTVAQKFGIEQLAAQGFFPKDTRSIEEPSASFENGKDELGFTIRSKDDYSDDEQAGFGIQLNMLVQREISNLLRDRTTTIGRLAITLILALMVGLLFLGVGNEDFSELSNIQSAFGAIMLVMMAGMFFGGLPTLLLFPQERPVFLREYSTNHFSVVSYFISKLCMEFIITGVQTLIMCIPPYFLIGINSNIFRFIANMYAMTLTTTAMAVVVSVSVEDPMLAQQTFPVIFVPQMMYSGVFVLPELIPSYLRWPRWLYPLTPGTRIALLDEFGDGCGGEEADENCEYFVDLLGADEDDLWWNWILVFGLFFVYRLIALLILKQKATKFL